MVSGQNSATKIHKTISTCFFVKTTYNIKLMNINNEVIKFEKTV